MKWRLSEGPQAAKQNKNPLSLLLYKGSCCVSDTVLCSFLMLRYCLRKERKKQWCCLNHLLPARGLCIFYLNGRFKKYLTLVVVLGNNSGFSSTHFECYFWQWQNNACNMHLTAWLILWQSVALSNYNRMLFFNHLPCFKDLTQLWNVKKTSSHFSQANSVELLTKQVTTGV